MLYSQNYSQYTGQTRKSLGSLSWTTLSLLQPCLRDNALLAVSSSKTQTRTPSNCPLPPNQVAAARRRNQKLSHRLRVAPAEWASRRSPRRE
jgi:hypothetical protein